MGGHAYYYFVPYEDDIDHALQALRQREFEAGRYNPAVRFLKSGTDASLTPSPGKQHRSIDEALEAAQFEGTRSILDIEYISEELSMAGAMALPPERLRELYGTERPTREMVQENMAFFENLDRGCAAYIVLFRGDIPSELLFAGLSCD